MLTLSFRPHCLATHRADNTGLVFGAVAALAAAALLSALTMRAAVQPGVPQAAPAIMLSVPGASLQALDAAAEIARTRLLGMPGVGAVRLQGLLTTGLEVDYAPARLARLGVTPDDLRAAVPAQAGRLPGRIPLRPEASQDGPQPVADRLVQAGGHSFRLGDIATVAHVRLDPISVLSRNGQPAVQIVVMPAPGADASAVQSRAAAEIDTLASTADMQR